MEIQTPRITEPDHETLSHNIKPKEGEDVMFFFNEDTSNNDSACSTPYVSAPSSPGRTPPYSGGGGGDDGGGGCGGPIHGGFFYSCPASPMHFAITTLYTQQTKSSSNNDEYGVCSSDFEFSARLGLTGSGETGSNVMSSADELFLDGKIRPMKLSTHLERPQVLSPLLDLEEEQESQEAENLVNTNIDKVNNSGGEKQSSGSNRGRDLIRSIKDKSLRRRRRTRSMSPMRTTSFEFCNVGESSFSLQVVNNINNVNEHATNVKNNDVTTNTTGANNTTSDSSNAASASSSRSSSAGRNSKRWIFLKDLLYRSKSEGRTSSINKFWSNISLSPTNKDKNNNKNEGVGSVSKDPTNKDKHNNKSEGVAGGSVSKDKNEASSSGDSNKKPVNGIGKRRRSVPVRSVHEMHYKERRAQAEEMRKKTYLPYRQGLIGCLGFSSKSYGAMSGFARSLNPVSSR